MENIKLSDVKASNMQPVSRETIYSPAKFNHLVTSYKEGKHIAPIRIRIDNGSYQCVYGHMRLKAMVEAGIEEVSTEDPRVIVEDEMLDKDADLETILENHNRQDLKWWEQGQQWRRFRESHDITQQELADMLPGVSLDVVKKIESGSKLADDQELVIIITKVKLGYNSAEHIMRIHGGPTNWKSFLELVEKYNFGVKDIDSYTKELAKSDGELLNKLLHRMCDEKLSVAEIRNIIRNSSHTTISEPEPSEESQPTQESPQVASEVLSPDVSHTEDEPDDIVERANKYVKMLRELTQELQTLCEKLNENDEYEEVANDLYKSVRDFLIVATEEYRLNV